MTEFAIIAPVLLLIVVGMLVCGRLFFYWIEANHIANETARWAVVDRNPYDPQTLQLHARESATKEFSDNAEVCILYPDPDNPGSYQAQDDVEPGDPVRVQVNLPISFAEFFGWGVTIKGSATMRVERLAGEDPTTKQAIPLNYNDAENLPPGTCS